MSKPILKIFIAVGENCELEAYALRATLEYLGIQVTMRWVGRPNDFIDIISGKENLEHIDYLILCFHGDEQRFCLAELAEEVYENNEPKTQFFTVEHIKKFAKFNQLQIISSGCTLGSNEIAQAILHSGAKLYIAPDRYIDAHSSFMFLVSLFYELTLGSSMEMAFRKAKTFNDEAAFYRLYKSDKHME